jgi:hypothetical protein
MPSNLRTFVKTRTADLKVLHIFVFLGIVASAWLIHDLAKLAMLEIPMLVP